MKSYVPDLDVLIREINAALRRYVSRKMPATLYEPPRYLFAGGGKRLRALLVLLACAAAGESYKRALDAAAAVEILHNFSLIHDDIMDHDAMRRGRATIHTKWDTNVAILSGDLLAAVAFQALSRCPKDVLPRVTALFSEGFIQLCEGQALDKEFESRPSVTEREYLRMITLKTSVLFRLSTRIGAIVAHAPASRERALADFGTSLGLAFQLQDDLLDVIADESVLGKSIGSDLIEHKKTYLSILASRDREGQDLLDRFRAGPDPNAHRALLGAFGAYLDRSGIRHTIDRKIDRYIRTARRQLDRFPDSSARRQLLQITDRLRNRQS